MDRLIDLSWGLLLLIASIVMLMLGLVFALAAFDFFRGKI